MSSNQPTHVAPSAGSQASENLLKGEVVNQKALNIIQRVKDKLTGKMLH